MPRSLFYGLLTAGLALSAPAQSNSGHEPCGGLPWFGPKDSLNTADSRVEPKDLRVRVSSKGPVLHLRLEPDPQWKAGKDAVQRVGWIRVFSCETGALVQSLEVASGYGPEMLTRWFEVRDVNFDGYLDVAVLREFGGKWGRQTWWVYSPASQTFVSNQFAKDLGAVTANGLVLDAARHEIIAPQLTVLSGCGNTRWIYRVEDASRLVLVHQENVQGTPGGCKLTVLDRVKGQMVVTKVREFTGKGK